MPSIKTIIIALVLMLTPIMSLAQITPETKDSTKIYKDIQTYSGKSKFTTFLYKLIFRTVPAKSKKTGTKKKIKKKPEQKQYAAFEGKIIRNVFIETLDPFGYSISDTLFTRQNSIISSGNWLHVKTQSITIRNLLLFRQNQLFDSLLVKESERLVRNQSYVRDVRFFFKSKSKKSDSVDIFIRELDNWSMIPKISGSTNGFVINIIDKNFAGTGHEFQNTYSWFRKSNDYSFLTNYYIPGFRNTFIKSQISYGTDEFGNSVKSVGVERPFFSVFAKWAAGIKFSQEFRRDSVWTTPTSYELQRIKLNTQDYWIGSAFKTIRGNSENSRVSNFVAAIRFCRVNYVEIPFEMTDSLHNYSDEKFAIAAIGISKRKYVQDKYIYKFGIVEDVPHGYVLSITSGYQIKNENHRKYLGANISFGKYYNWGYLSSSFDYGIFYSDSHYEQGSISANIEFFTNLLEIGNWKIRQFIKPQLLIGINRFSYDSLTLNNGYGLNGFSSPVLKGTSRILFTIQTQSYAPWNLIGFRFGPFFICSFGMLGNAGTGFNNSKIFSQFGVGVIIKNENLIINSFQLSISFYPKIPGKGLNIFKTNSIQTTDFGFRDFVIAKPASVIYQ